MTGNARARSAPASDAATARLLARIAVPHARRPHPRQRDAVRTRPMTAPAFVSSTKTARRADIPPAPPRPWHQRLLELLPRWIHRRVLRVEAAIADGVAAFAA